MATQKIRIKDLNAYTPKQQAIIKELQEQQTAGKAADREAALAEQRERKAQARADLDLDDEGKRFRPTHLVHTPDRAARVVRPFSKTGLVLSAIKEYQAGHIDLKEFDEANRDDLNGGKTLRQFIWKLAESGHIRLVRLD